LCHKLAQSKYNFASRKETKYKSLKWEVIMWLAVIIGVSLSVEVLSYLTGGEI
jgi:hypothetical protein